MVLSAVTLLLLSQAPKTFEALEIEKINAYHGLKGYREELEVRLGVDESATILRMVELDGGRSHAIMSAPDGGRVESFNDGTTIYMIVHPRKEFQLMPAPQAMPFDPKTKLAKAEPESIKFTYTASDDPILFACDPPFVLRSIDEVTEKDRKLRRAVAVTGKNGRSVTLTQWFLPDRWLLTRFVIEGEDKEGKIKIVGNVLKMELNRTYNDKSFKPEPELVLGYRRIGG